MPHAISPSPPPASMLSRSTSRHRRTRSLDLAPSYSISTKSSPLPVADHWQKPWQFDDTSDEEVPEATVLEVAMRRAIAQAHIETRLRTLRAEEYMEGRRKDADASARQTTIAPLLEETSLGVATAELGLICPRHWRSTDHEEAALDRRWLHQVNPGTFDEEGVLREKYMFMKRPKHIPLLYWQWLQGTDKVKTGVDKWAEGWTAAGPTRSWISRWLKDELTAKEISGRRRVGFVLEAQVSELQ